MASPFQANRFLPKPDRRFFLSSLIGLGAGLGLTTQELHAGKRPETSYHFRTSECEVRMDVQFLTNATGGFRFRDRLTNRSFCLSARGEEDHGCLERFVGAMAIARYAFRTRPHSAAPRNLRERVLIIDTDNRMPPTPPFERSLVLEKEVASDIQAFGYNPYDEQQTASDTKALAPWRLLRQDLFLDDQSTAFLIVHWKHTFNGIHLLDVIPGDRTELSQV